MASRDQLVASLAVAGLPFEGTTAQLRKRLLEHMMSTAPPAISPSPIPAPLPKYVDVEEPMKKKGKKERKPRAPTAYNLFVKEMVPVVANEGYKGKEMLKRISELWAMKKNETPLLMLTDKSSSGDMPVVEQLVDSLYALDLFQLRANLAAFHLDVSGSKEEIVERLALAMCS